MLLKEYLTDINNTIADCAGTGLIISSDVMADIRTEKSDNEIWHHLPNTQEAPTQETLAHRPV